MSKARVQFNLNINDLFLSSLDLKIFYAYRLELLDYIPCTGCIIVIALPDLLPAPNGSVFFLDVATIFFPFKCLCACNKKEREEEEH